MRRFVADVARTAGFSDSRILDVQVSISEACANAIEHGSAERDIEVTARTFADRLEVDVLGGGRFRPPAKDPETRVHRGLGLPLMASLSDHLALYSRHDGATMVSLIFYAPGVVPGTDGEEARPPGQLMLQEEKELLEGVLDHSPAGIFVVGPDLRYRLVNSTYRSILDPYWRQADVIGRELREVLPGRGAEHVIQVIQSVIELGEPFEELESRYDGFERGTTYWNRVVLPLPTVDSPPYDVMVLVTDVTAQVQASRRITKLDANRARARRELATSAERLKILSEGAAELLRTDAPQPVVERLCARVMDQLGCEVFLNLLLSPDGSCLELNGHAGITAAEAESIRGLGVSLAVPGSVAPAAGLILSEDSPDSLDGLDSPDSLDTADIPDKQDAMTRLIRSFGIRAHCSHLLMDGERVIGALSFGARNRSAFGQDEIAFLKAVADLVAVALSKKRAADIVRQQWVELQSIYQSVPVGLCVLDRGLRFLRINRRMAEMNGAPAEDHIGRTVAEMAPGIAERARALAESVFGSGRAIVGVEIEGETRADPNERRVWIESWLPLRDDAGAVGWINVVAEEITERCQAERQREILLDEAEELTEELMAANEELQTQNEELVSQTEELLAARRRLSSALDMSSSLNKVSLSITSDLDMTEIIRLIILQGIEALGCAGGLLLFRDGSQWIAEQAIGIGAALTGTRFNASDAPIEEEMIAKGDVIAVEDSTRDGRVPGRTPISVLGARAALAVPVMLRNDCLGSLQFLYDLPRAFDVTELDFARNLSAALALSMENRGLLGAEKERSRLAEALAGIHAAVHSSLDVPKILQRGLERASEALGASSAAVAFRHPTGKWTVTHVVGLPDETLGTVANDEQQRHAVLAIEKGRVVAVEDVTVDDRVHGAYLRSLGISSVIAVPLFAGRTPSGVALFNYSSGPVRFSRAQLGFASHLADAMALAMSNAEIAQSQRNIAARLQESLQDMPAKVSGLELRYLYRSATKDAALGGDFYDAFALEGGRVALLIGDVCGHGVEAARKATLVKDAVRVFCSVEDGPEGVLRQANRFLAGRNPAGFVTVFLGFVDPDSGLVRFASAGHPGPLLLDIAGGGATALPSGSYPLGVFSEVEYVPREVRIDSQTGLLLFTDGVTEARRDGRLLGYDGLQRLIRSWVEARPRTRDRPAEGSPLQGGLSLAGLLGTVLDGVLDHSDGVLEDDLAMVAVRCRRE